MSNEPFEGVVLDPYHPDDMNVTIEAVASFINAERLAMGKPPCKTIIVLGSDKPYTEFGDATHVDFKE